MSNFQNKEQLSKTKSNEKREGRCKRTASLVVAAVLLPSHKRGRFYFVFPLFFVFFFCCCSSVAASPLNSSTECDSFVSSSSLFFPSATPCLSSTPRTPMSSYFPDPVDEPPASNSASGSRGSRSHVGHFANTLGAVAHSAARGADNGRSFSGSYSSHSEALTSTPPFFPRGQQQPSGRGPAAVAAFTHAHVAQTDVSGSPLPTRPPPFTRLSAQSGAASSSRSPYSSERDVTRRSVWRDVQFPTAVEHRSNPMLLKQLWTKAVLGEPVTVESTLYLPKIVVQRAVILSLRDIATGGRGAGFAHEVFLVGRQRAATLEGSDSRQSTPATNTLAFERVASTEAERRQGPDEVWMRVTVVMNAQNAPSSASGASFNQIDYQRLMAACVACDRSHPAGLLQLHSLISFSNSRVEQVFEMQTLAVFPSLCLQLAALLPLRLFASPLAEVLCQASHSNVEPQAGYLTLDRGRCDFRTMLRN